MAEGPAISDAELTEVFLEEVLASPVGEKIKTCIQCGTCSASCPTSYAWEHTPRQVIGLFRAGMLRYGQPLNLKAALQAIRG